MIDTHSHIYGPEFADDLEEVITRAQTVGVEKIFLPNINVGTLQPMLSLCRRFPGYLYPMLGLHPTDLTPDYERELEILEKELQPGHPYIAIGEVGLDYYWSREYYNEQQIAFRRQIEWALEFRLPLMIHTRSAHQELVSVLDDYRHSGLTGVFHCFGGSAEEARELLAFEGFVLGVGGVVTYKKSVLPEVLQQIPLDRIVLETDAPYLAPVPYRGTRNESAYVSETLRALTNIYNVSKEDLETITDKTVKRIFCI